MVTDFDLLLEELSQLPGYCGFLMSMFRVQDVVINKAIVSSLFQMERNVLLALDREALREIQGLLRIFPHLDEMRIICLSDSWVQPMFRTSLVDMDFSSCSNTSRGIGMAWTLGPGGNRKLDFPEDLDKYSECELLVEKGFMGYAVNHLDPLIVDSGVRMPDGRVYSLLQSIGYMILGKRMLFDTNANLCGFRDRCVNKRVSTNQQMISLEGDQYNIEWTGGFTEAMYAGERLFGP